MGEPGLDYQVMIRLRVERSGGALRASEAMAVRGLDTRGLQSKPHGCCGLICLKRLQWVAATGLRHSRNPLQRYQWVIYLGILLGCLDSVRSLQKTILDASPGMTYGNTYCRKLCSMIQGIRGGV